MWFVMVFVGLGLLALAGTYLRRRLAGALSGFGASPRTLRIARWLQAWLLFGFPVLLFGAFTISRLAGAETMPRFDSRWTSTLLGMPFAWAVLVVFQSVPWLLAIDVAYLIRRRRAAAAAIRMRAIGVLAVLGIFALYTPIRILVERGDVRYRTHRIAASPAASPTASAPPLRIAFLADIQQDDHTDAARAAAVYDRIGQFRPDLVLSGGDWINAGPDHIDRTAATAARLQSRLGTFSVRGDHEHFAYLDRDRSVSEIEGALRKHGIAMLNNEVRWFEHAGKRIAVLFLNYNYIVRTDRETVQKLVESLAGADYKILVTHQFDGKLADLVANRVDLVLAGHTHGGQVNPVLGITHVNLARVETRFVDGRYQLGSTTIIVTAGVGYSIIPIRYASPGSVELIELAL